MRAADEGQKKIKNENKKKRKKKKKVKKRKRGIHGVHPETAQKLIFFKEMMKENVKQLRPKKSERGFCSLVVMEVPACVSCWNGPSCRSLSVGACRFGHFGRQADDGSDDLVDLAEQVCELCVALAKLAAAVIGAPVPVLEADAKGIPKRGLDKVKHDKATVNTHEVSAEEQEFQECITEEIIDVMTASNTMQSGGLQESSRLMSTTTTSSASVNGEFDTRSSSLRKNATQCWERMHEQTVDAAVPQMLEEPVAPIPEFQEETVEVFQLSPQERVSVDEAWPPWFESDLAESSDEASSEEAKRPRHWSRRHWGRRQGARDGWSWAKNSWSWHLPVE